MVEQELMLFLIGQDMDVALQRALNYEQFDLVRDIRQRREGVREKMCAMCVRHA